MSLITRLKGRIAGMHGWMRLGILWQAVPCLAGLWEGILGRHRKPQEAMEGHLGKLWASRKGRRHLGHLWGICGICGKLGKDGSHRKPKEGKQARKEGKGSCAV